MSIFEETYLYIYIYIVLDELKINANVNLLHVPNTESPQQVEECVKDYIRNCSTLSHKLVTSVTSVSCKASGIR